MKTVVKHSVLCRDVYDLMETMHEYPAVQARPNWATFFYKVHASLITVLLSHTTYSTTLLNPMQTTNARTKSADRPARAGELSWHRGLQTGKQNVLKVRQKFRL